MRSCMNWRILLSVNVACAGRALSRLSTTNFVVPRRVQRRRGGYGLRDTIANKPRNIAPALVKGIMPTRNVARHWSALGKRLTPIIKGNGWRRTPIIIRNGRKLIPKSYVNISVVIDLRKRRAAMICPICNKAFKPRHLNQRYCSEECYRENYNRRAREYQRRRRGVIRVKCPICGVEFERHIPNQLYCSEECRLESRRRWRRAHYRRNTKLEQSNTKLERRECPICGKEFEPRHFKQKYCSTECTNERNRRWQREYQRRYYASRKAKLAAYQREYRALHRKRINFQQKKRRWRHGL